MSGRGREMMSRIGPINGRAGIADICRAGECDSGFAIGPVHRVYRTMSVDRARQLRVCLVALSNSPQ